MSTNSNGTQRSYEGSVRMRKDSAIWINFVNPENDEDIRLLLTKDSVKFMVRKTDDKRYYQNDSAALSKLTGVPLNFDALQDILLGQAAFLNFAQDKFASRTHNFDYVLVSEFSRKLKRLTDLNEKVLYPGTDTLEVMESNQTFERIRKRADASELMMRRYWLDGKSYLLEKIAIDDLYHNRSVEISYGDFQETGGRILPHTIGLQIEDLKGSQNVDLKIEKIERNKKYKFPYAVPDDFERKYD